MNDETWLIQELENLIAQTPDYEKRALLHATIDMVHEQTKRIEQAQGELDGRIWNHEQW